MFAVDYSSTLNNQVNKVSIEDNNSFSHVYFVFRDIDTRRNVHRMLLYHMMMFAEYLDVNDEYDMYLT